MKKIPTKIFLTILTLFIIGLGIWNFRPLLSQQFLFKKDQLHFTNSSLDKSKNSPRMAFQEILEKNGLACQEAFESLSLEFKGPFTLEHQVFQAGNNEEGRILSFIDKLASQVFSRQISTIIFDSLEVGVNREEISAFEFNRNIQNLNICRDSRAIDILETLFKASKMNNYSLKLKRSLGKKLMQSLVQEGGGGFYTFDNLFFRLGLLKKMITYDFLPPDHNEQIMDLDERIFDANNSDKKLKDLLALNKSFSAELFDLSSELYRKNQLLLQ